MTQLVQLQQELPQFQSSGFVLFAISNDTVERLANFSSQHKITYPLLSDEDSAVIRHFGILNQLIRPDEGKHMRWYGIPYPGTFIVDAAGTIVDKDFHQHHARRLSGPTLLRRALGTEPQGHQSAPVTCADTQWLKLEVSLSDPVLKLEVITELVIRIRVNEGWHVYAAGAPEAFTALRIDSSGTGLRFGQACWPASTPLQLPGLDSVVPVFDGEFTVSIPVTATSSLIRLGHEPEQPTTRIDVVCTYQACNDAQCEPAVTLEAALIVRLEELVAPDGLKTYAARAEAGRGNSSS